MELGCWNVTCRTAAGDEYEVGVMASDASAAKRVAENSLREGRAVEAKAVRAEETDSI